MRKGKLYLSALAALTAFFTVAPTATSFADNVIADGDGLAPLVSNNTVAFGSVCTGGGSVQKTVLVAVSRNGNAGPQVYANGATVSITTSTTPSAISATGGSVTLPANWSSVANNTQSNTISSTVTLNPTNLTTGSFSGSVIYTGTAGSVSRNVNVTVTATIQTCNTPPTLNLPADISAEATSGGGAIVTYTATASDAEDGTLTPSCSPASGATFSLGTTTVNCSVTDSGGLTATGSFKIKVQDTTAPVLALANVTAEATGPSGASVTFSESASDVVDGSVSVSCSPSSPHSFALGTTTVNCSATDAAGNTATGSFTVTVVDTTAPSLTLPADISGVEATGPSGADVNFSTGASDVVDGSVVVSCSRQPGDTFPIGTTTVNCSATDTAGNTATGSFTVTVVDTTAPDVTVPSDKTVEATGPGGATVNFANQVTASDLVDGTVNATCNPSSGSTFPLGDTTVNCSATDNAGNTGSASFKITVVDTTAPAIDAHGDVSVLATGPSGAVVTYTAPATHDAVDGTGTATCTPASGSAFPIGATTVTCTATDSHGNSAAPTTFVVHVSLSLKGFYQPTDMSGIWNTVKNGSTVPLKFEIFAGSTEVTDTSYVKQPLTATQTPCLGGQTDAIELTATGATALRYDTTAGQFVYNWQTPKKIGFCYVVTVGTIDGSSLSAKFQLK